MKKLLMNIESLYKEFTLGGGFLQKRTGVVQAVDDVNLQIFEGETLGLVGESGCGKSTLARILMRLEEPQKGKVIFEGRDIFAFSSEELKAYRRNVQMVFQDPYSSLNPRKTALGMITEPLKIHSSGSREQNRQAALKIMDKVNIRKNPQPRAGVYRCPACGGNTGDSPLTFDGGIIDDRFGTAPWGIDRDYVACCSA